jgi:hypothetical protein
MYKNSDIEVEINFENIYNIMAEKNKSDSQRQSQRQSENMKRHLLSTSSNESDSGLCSCLYTNPCCSVCDFLYYYLCCCL